MTVQQLLASVDSAELTAWAVFFEVRAEKDDDARKAAAFQRKLGA